MDSLHVFFQFNRQPILLLYGLSFFVLGLAVALQSRRHSRLDLARSLPWLAAFGLVHALGEWGDLFLPLQELYLTPPIFAMANLIQMALFALSFACLFEFGVLLLRPTGRVRLLYYLPVLLLLVWAGSILFFRLEGPSELLWHREGDAIARYAIGFPGALFATYGLYWHARRRIAPLHVLHVVRMLQVAVAALAFYAVLSGLIPAPVPFFPGNVVNTVSVEAAIGIPPSVFRSVVGVVLAIAIIRALDIFDLETERFIESIEQRQILAAERERIARELHDGVIQKVYTAGLLIQAAQQQCPSEGIVRTRLERATAVLNDAIADLRRHLGDLHSTSVDRSLPEALRLLACDPRFQSLVDVSLDLDFLEGDCLSASRSEQVAAIVQEALSNVVRHARARHVRIEGRQKGERLELTVEDDGVGLPQPLHAGYGVRNMRNRARMLGGEVEMVNGAGRGTRVRIEIPQKGDE